MRNRHESDWTKIAIRFRLSEEECADAAYKQCTLTRTDDIAVIVRLYHHIMRLTVLIDDLGAGGMAATRGSFQHHASAHDQVFSIDNGAFIFRQDSREPASREGVHRTTGEKSYTASNAPV